MHMYLQYEYLIIVASQADARGPIVSSEPKLVASRKKTQVVIPLSKPPRCNPNGPGSRRVEEVLPR
jgi:hypothetical protein